MRIAVLSDIHGNAEALKAVLADVNEQPEIDNLILLGDYLAKGPQCREVLDIIRNLDAVKIRGNSEEGLDLENPFADVPFDIVPFERRRMEEWFRKQLSPQDFAYLKGFPLSYSLDVNRQKWHFIHASLTSTTELIFPGQDHARLLSLFPDEVTAVVVYGHIHQAFMRVVDGRYVVNAGSIGQPLDGDTRACYLILDSAGESLLLEFRRIKYDIEVPIKIAYDHKMPGAETYESMIRNACYPYRGKKH